MYVDNAISAKINNENIVGKMFRIMNLEECTCMRH